MAAKKRKSERELAAQAAPVQDGDAPVTKASVAAALKELRDADAARAAKMPGRKATSAEITREIRASRRKAGVTKSGAKRKDAPKAAPKDTEEGLGSITASERGETSASALREMTGRATGLSEDIGESGMSATELVQSGVYLGDFPEAVDPQSARAQTLAAEEKFWEDLGRTPEGQTNLDKALATIRAERGQTPSNKKPYDETRATAVAAADAERKRTAAVQSVRRTAPISRTTGLPTGEVLPPDVPLTQADALARQQFFTGDTSGRLRTTQPGLVQVPTIDDKGQVRVTHIPRPNRATIEPLEKSLLGPARRSAGEATRMLDIASVLEKIDKFSATKEPIETHADDPRGTQRTQVVTNAKGNQESRTVTTRSMTRGEAARLALNEGHITPEEFRLVNRRGLIPGQSSSPKILRTVTGQNLKKEGIVTEGSGTEVTPEFKSNVAALVTRAEALPDVPVTEETPFQTMGGGSAQAEVQPEAYSAYVEKVAKTQKEDKARTAKTGKKSTRFARIEAGPYPKNKPKKIDMDPTRKAGGLPGVTSIGDFITADMVEAAEGSNSTEKLRNILGGFNPQKRAEAIDALRKIVIPEGAEVPLSKEEAGSEAVTRERAAQGLPAVNTQVDQGSWPLVAKARRMISRRAGRDIGSQTADEAARITAAEDWTKRFISKDLMGAPEGAGGSSQAALHIRAADPRRRGVALDQTRVNRAGLPEPTDEQIVYAQNAAVHKAATEAANAHHNMLYSHLAKSQETAQGYNAAAFSTITRGGTRVASGLVDLADRLGDLGGTRSAAIRKGVAEGLERFKAQAVWDRTPGGAGALRTGQMTEEEKAAPPPVEGRDRGPEWTKRYVTPISTEALRPVEIEATQAAANRAKLMTTPEGRAEIAAGKAASEEALQALRGQGLTSGYTAGTISGASDDKVKENLKDMNILTWRQPGRPTGYAIPAIQGIEAARSAFRDKIAAEVAAKPHILKMPARGMPYQEGRKLYEVGQNAQTRDSAGRSMLGRIERWREGVGGWGDEDEQSSSYKLRQTYKNIRQSSTTGYGEVAKRGITEAARALPVYEGPSREAPRGGGFFQRVGAAKESPVSETPTPEAPLPSREAPRGGGFFQRVGNGTQFKG